MQTFTQTKLGALMALLLMASPFTGRTATVIPVDNNPICTNYATDGATPFWAPLSDLYITEGSSNDFGNTAGAYTLTFTINAPSGWEFNPSVTPNVDIASGDLDGTATITSFTATALTVTLTGTGNTQMDEIIIEGLRARATSTASAAANMTITVDAGSTMVGVTNGDPIATLSPEAPASGSASVLTGASGTTICAGETVNFSATPTMGGEAPGYQWHIGSADVAGATSSTFSSATLADADDVTVTLTSHECITSPVATSAATTMTVKALPSAITGSNTVCVNSVASLNSTPAAGTWTSSNTAQGSVNATTGEVTGVSAGTTNISYQAPNGCYTTAMMTVNPLPAAITGTLNACVGAAQTLANADAGGTWTSSSASTATVGTSGIVSGVAAGTAHITYTLPTSCTTTSIFTVNALPAAQVITGSGSYCAGGSGLAIGLGSSMAGTTYDLYNGATHVATATGTGSPITFGTYTAATTYTATATSATGCHSNMTGDATVSITAVVTPAVTINVTPGDTICSGTATTFTAAQVNGGTAPTYAWSVNSTPMGTGDTYNYTPADGDVVSVTMTSNAACPSTATVSHNRAMTVVASQTPAVTISVTNDNLCQYTPVTFSVATSAHTGTAPVYTWYKGSTSTGITGTSWTYMPADGDVISARLNSNYRCPVVNNVSSNTVNMNVDSVFIPAVEISTNAGTEIAPAETVTFTATVTKAGSATPKYQWYKNAVVINGATASTYTTSTLANNDSMSVVVRAAGICNAATPAFNSVRMKVTTGFVHTTLAGARVTLAPNPNNGAFAVKGNLNTSANTEVLLEVTNMLGQVLYTNVVVAQGGSIEAQVQPAGTLPDGIYIMTLRAGAERRAFRFVVKQ